MEHVLPQTPVHVAQGTLEALATCQFVSVRTATMQLYVLEMEFATHLVYVVATTATQDLIVL